MKVKNIISKYCKTRDSNEGVERESENSNIYLYKVNTTDANSYLQGIQDLTVATLLLQFKYLLNLDIRARRSNLLRLCRALYLHAAA